MNHIIIKKVPKIIVFSLIAYLRTNIGKFSVKIIFNLTLTKYNAIDDYKRKKEKKN